MLCSGCDTSERAVQAAYGDYQAASAAGDMRAARLALLELVQADDGVASYWIELGKVQLALGNFGESFYAFTRAHELDRGDVEVLSTLTQLALLSGNTDAAEGHAKRLELLAPSHPAVALTYGHVALRRSDLDEAERRADQLLEGAPFDTSAKLLKARVLLTRGDVAATEDLLSEQVRVQGQDATSARALAVLLEQQNRWKDASVVSERLWRLQPSHFPSAAMVIRTALLAGDPQRALSVSEEMLTPTATGEQVGEMLDIWSRHASPSQAVDAGQRLYAKAGATYALAFASYFNRVGAPQLAMTVLGPRPDGEITKSNASRNAILAESLALRGERQVARRLLDQVLQIEPDHVAALRARVDLLVASGGAKAAIRDAQRLVSITPESSDDRLRLARAFEAAGNPRQRDRVLWSAFNEIPADARIYAALRKSVAIPQGPEATARLDREYAAQRNSSFMRDFV